MKEKLKRIERDAEGGTASGCSGGIQMSPRFLAVEMQGDVSVLKQPLGKLPTHFIVSAAGRTQGKGTPTTGGLQDTPLVTSK